MDTKYIRAYILLLGLYVLLAFTLPTDPYTLEKYRLSKADITLLNLTVVTPIVAVYLTALFGFLRFRSYAQSVETTDEGAPMRQIANGLMVLAFGLPFNSIAGSLLNYFAAYHANLLPAATVLRHYATLLVTIVAFSYLARGAAGLLQTLKNHRIELPALITLLGPVVLASVFTGLVMTEPHDEGRRLAYYLPDWVVVITLIIPYVYIWCRAASAVYSLFIYQSRVKGLVYKRAVKELAKGIAVIVFLSIALQLVIIFSARINRLNLTPLLLVVYVLVGLYALGYGFVARSSKRLKKFEDV